MSPLRLLLVVAGAGTLLAGVPVANAGSAGSDASVTANSGERGAMELLTAASRAARTRAYSGTQYVSTWHEDTASSSVADIRHTPESGTIVDVHPTAGGDVDASATPTPDVEPRLLDLLAKHYDLSVAADASCTGRPAHVVEARRTGQADVAGRFWIDAATSLVLRRETFDASGRLVRSSAFATLTVGPTSSDVAAVTTGGDRLSANDLDAMRRDGWQIPAALAGDLELYDARLHTHDGQRVLHLSYSDGLSTLSLFAQRGRLGAARMAGYTRQKLGRSAVWIRSAMPERVVWAGGGRVFTLLSDAPTDTVRAAVTVLPHEKSPRTGFFARLGRGLARLASWLNPFS
jgi:sigma-E factor negative regulatory protein RseB